MFDVDLGSAFFDFFWRYIVYFSLGYFISCLISIFTITAFKHFKLSRSKILVFVFFWLPALILSYFLTSFLGYTDEIFRETIRNSTPVVLILLTILFILLLKQNPASIIGIIMLIIAVSFIIGFDCAFIRVSFEDRMNKKEQTIEKEFTLQMSSLYKIIDVQKIDQTNRNFQITFSVPRDDNYIIFVSAYVPKDNIENDYSTDMAIRLLHENNSDFLMRLLFLKQGINKLNVSIKKDIDPANLSFLDLDFSIKPKVWIYSRKISPTSQIIEGIDFCSPMINQCSGYLSSIPEIQNAMLHIKIH